MNKLNNAGASAPLVWINQTPYAIPQQAATTTTLNQFLRQTLGLTGTKIMCGEGGCGACVVHVRRPLPATSDNNSAEMNTEHSVNSCLVLLMSCVGWHITTIEANTNGQNEMLGAIQQRVREHHGTQCGYCTPAFCMQQYSTLAASSCEAVDIENSFDGNICRCTGYRPILDAMKSFGKNVGCTSKMKKDLDGNVTAVNGSYASGKYNASVVMDGWYAPNTLKQLRVVSKHSSLRVVGAATFERAV